MQELAGKTAFVSGAASGIGFALSQTLARVGMKVMLADIETDALAAAVEKLNFFGPNARGVRCDVTDPTSVENAAKASYEAFGNIHVVCNNAGVGGGSGIDNVSLDTWRWVIDVNLMGVLHGIKTFLPHIRAHGEGGHIASAAGKLLAQLTELGRAGLDPIDVAAQVLTPICENELYVFTHAGADWRAELKERFAAILAAMDKAARRQGF